MNNMNDTSKARHARTLPNLALSLSSCAMILLYSFGCAGENESVTPFDDHGTANASAATVSPEMLAELRQRVPELGEEPLPEPTPGENADPSNIPERLRKALTKEVLETITGDATFYADKFEGRRTASGIPFRQNQLVAAHRAYPFGTILRVTNLNNDRTVNVRVVDRGPFAAPGRARRPVIDLSRRAATQLGMIDAGVGRVRIEVLQWGKGISS